MRPFKIINLSGILLGWLLLLAACQGKQQYADDAWPDEAVIERWLQEAPDSLAHLLEEEISPDELSDSARAEYGWWITHLHQRQERSMVNDTLIHHTLRQDKERQSPRLAETYLLAALQTNYTGTDREESKALFSQGIQIAIERKDTALLAEVARSFGYHALLQEELPVDPETIKQILHDYYAADSTELMRHFYALGCHYALSAQAADSMEHYMTQAVRLAEALHSDNNGILRNYIDGLNTHDQSAQALPLLRKFDRLYPPAHSFDSITRASTYVCLWINLGRRDSAEFYLKQLEDCCTRIPEDYYWNGYRNTLFYIEKLLRSVYDVKYDKPLNILPVYELCEKMASIERKRIAIEEERKFVQNRLERKNAKLNEQKERNRRLALYGLLAAACLIFFLAYLYQRKLLNKERFIRQMKEQIRLHQITLSEKEQWIRQNEEQIEALSALQSEQEEQIEQQLNDRRQEIDQIRQENDRLLREKRQLQQEIEQYARNIPEKSGEMNAYERLASQNQQLITGIKQLALQRILQYDELEHLYKGELRSLTEIDWPVVYKRVDQVFNAYTKRLRKAYPLLTEEDIQCCCLIKLQLSNAAIARLYNIAPSSVTKRKQRIKERINQAQAGLVGKEQPVDVYLWGF